VVPIFRTLSFSARPLVLRPYHGQVTGQRDTNFNEACQWTRRQTDRFARGFAIGIDRVGSDIQNPKCVRREATMIRWLVPFIVLASFGTAAPAMAGEPGPVCREPSVVDEMTLQVRDHNYYGHVDPQLVTETPTRDRHVVDCQVCVQSAPYDTIRFGDQPIRQCLPHWFEVRILPNGFVVHDLR
jgi:hypothetical protein